jgi:hypothetical protein
MRISFTQSYIDLIYYGPEDRFKSICVFGFAGRVTGGILWLFTEPGGSVVIAVGSGAVLGAICYRCG